MAWVYLTHQQQLLPGGHQLDHLYRPQIPGLRLVSNGKIIFAPNRRGRRSLSSSASAVRRFTAPTNGGRQLHQLIGELILAANRTVMKDILLLPVRARASRRAP